MNTTRHPDVQLADGFRFTDHLDAPYRLACYREEYHGYGVKFSGADGREQWQSFDHADHGFLTFAYFSPDGTTLYWYGSHLWRQDLATGTRRQLPDTPDADGYQRKRCLGCSPDNTTLLFMHHLVLPDQSVASGQPNRCLYRVSTEGTDYRVLHENTSEAEILGVVCSWENGFAVVFSWGSFPQCVASDAWKVDLNTGSTTQLSPLEEGANYLSIRPDGTEITWATPRNTIYTRTLDDGITRKLPCSGANIKWSPTGQYLAFGEMPGKLCLWNVQQEQVEDIVGFESPWSSYYYIRGYGRPEPVWAPDGSRLWFRVKQFYSQYDLHTFRDYFREAILHLRPILHNLNPTRTTRLPRYHSRYSIKKTGIIDLQTRQVLLSDDYYTCVTWLPRPVAKRD